MKYEGRNWSLKKWAYVMDIPIRLLVSRLKRKETMGQALNLEALNGGMTRNYLGELVPFDDSLFVPDDWESTKATIEKEHEAQAAKNRAKQSPSNIEYKGKCLLRITETESGRLITVNRATTVSDRVLSTT